MKKIFNRKVFGIMALAVACVMLGTCLPGLRTADAADTVAYVASPYTAAIALVENSIVGVNNYQVVNYNNYGNGYGNGYGYNFPWGDFFGYGPYGGYGNGNGNGNNRSEEIEYGSGSGVVVAKNYVLTNYHVVEGASSLKIAIPSDTDESNLLEATVAAYDSDKDVAVLYVPDLTLEPVTLGDSDALKVGDYVFNIGNPIGFTNTVTAGIVSALNRSISTDTKTDRYGRRTEVVNTMIQTDAAINSGNSGGGMFNTAGELVGIPTLKYTGSRYSSNAAVESIGMCIPINEAKPVIEAALNGTGNVDQAQDQQQQDQRSGQNAQQGSDMIGKPRLGVSITTLSGSAVTNGILPRGAYVAEVEDGSPAQEAGIQVGDIIVEADGQLISNVSDLQTILKAKNEGDEVALKVYRTGVNLYETQEIPEDCEYVDLTAVLAIVDHIAQ